MYSLPSPFGEGVGGEAFRHCLSYGEIRTPAPQAGEQTEKENERTKTRTKIKTLTA
jgi:hypothetical protein